MGLQSKSVIDTVVILAGGYGSRLGEATEKLPKPLVRVGGKPIICHVMDVWMRVGIKNFIIAGGYLFDELLRNQEINSYPVCIVNTGEETQTGGRILSLHQHLLGLDSFGLSYGDGITTHPLDELINFSNQHSGVVSMLLTHPISRFGEVEFNVGDGQVTAFSEKPIDDKWINAGFFIMKKSIFSFIEKSSDILETDVFKKLVDNKLLYALPSNSWWHCMDTPKDVKELDSIWDKYGEWK